MDLDAHVVSSEPTGSDEGFTISGWDVLLVVACAAAFTAGAQAASGVGSFGLIAAMLGICAACYLAGSLLLRWRVLRTGIWLDFPLKFLAGYVLVSTSLFAMAWMSPLSIGANFAFVALALVAGAVALRPRFLWGGTAAAAPAVVAVLVALVAALLWAQDSIHPTETLGEVTVFKPWLDGFYHASHVRIFSDAHGAASLEDFRMAGVPTRPYHYVPYMVPALVRALSGIPAYAAFAGVLVPMGIALTGLAAYALVASWWGAWPGLCATVALLLLPDGFQQGCANGFLGYHWMQAVGPGGMYGTAVLALAWLLVLRGCLASRLTQVVAGWCFAAVAVGYKAQFFVASACLLWMLPPLFMRGLPRRTRLAWSLAALTAFVAVVSATGRLPGTPLLQFDGSSTGELLGMVRTYAQPGWLTAAFDRWVRPARSLLALRGLGGVYLVVAVLGALALAYPVLAFTGRRRMALPLLLLPALIWGNFVVMALGLAMDDRGVGMREELLHRPFVLAYFMTAAWVGGAIGLFLFSGQGGSSRIRQVAVAAASLFLLAVPARLGEGVQRIQGIPFSFLAAPNGLVGAAEFVRKHAAPDDVVQESTNDQWGLVTALSERRVYVMDFRVKTGGREPDELRRRVESVARLEATPDEAALRSMAHQLGIRWFILGPEARVAWPSALLVGPAFEQGGYRVFRLY